VYLIGAVDAEPGLLGGEELFCADSDVRKAFALAEAGGFTVGAASGRARDLRDSDAYRERHARGVDLLLKKTHLDAHDLARILQ
jgi:hypothetical protein